MIINKLMRNQLEMVDWVFIKKTSLPDGLREIISQGFIDLDNCLLSKKLFSFCTSISIDDFNDEIAFECFVNSFHMEDYVSLKHLEYAIIFCNEIHDEFDKKYIGELNFILSLDDETLLPTIKFHLKRENASWLDEENLNSSIQAVLVTTGKIIYNGKETVSSINAKSL